MADEFPGATSFGRGRSLACDGQRSWPAPECEELHRAGRQAQRGPGQHRRETGSASSAAVNSGSINTGTRLFQASFDSADWSGKLTGRRCRRRGRARHAEWRPTLPAADDRGKSSPSTAPVPRCRSSGQTSTPTARRNCSSTDDGLGDAIGCDWLRGTRRGRSAGRQQVPRCAPDFSVTSSIRRRHSWAPPAFRYPDNLESVTVFLIPRGEHQTRDSHGVRRRQRRHAARLLHGRRRRQTALGRRGGTDGLHSGRGVQESSSASRHRCTRIEYFVDGSPVTGDAFFGGAWRTMLVAGLNKGGQGSLRARCHRSCKSH